jgi:uncharacterized protein (TIGR00369 family)
MHDRDAKQMATNIFLNAPFIQHLGATVSTAGHGWVEATLPLQTWMTQQDGVAHAGIGTSFADHAMGAAAYTMMPPGCSPLSVEITVRLLRPTSGTRLRCRAEVLKPGRRVMSVEADVWSIDADGQETYVMRTGATMAVIQQEKNKA